MRHGAGGNYYMSLLVARGLRKKYPTGVVAVENVDLEMDRGIYALMGPNGSGKTTTLSMITGSLKPDSGEVLVKGYSMWGDGWVEARKLIGFAPQDMPFYKHLTAMNNLVYYGLLHGLSIFESKRRGRELLEAVGLWETRNRQVSKLSGGMRRRLAIAAALIHDPEILVLDEPASGLDPKAREELWSLLITQWGDRLIVFSSHDGEEVERFATQVYIMHRGRVIEKGEPEELKKRYMPHPKAAVLIPEGEAPTIYGVEPERVGMMYRYPLEKLTVEDIVHALREGGVKFTRIEVVEPSLSEVFISLTGERLS